MGPFIKYVCVGLSGCVCVSDYFHFLSYKSALTENDVLTVTASSSETIS